MIKFKALTMKAKNDDMHIIFLLKKNVKNNIIKTILGYFPIAVPKTLKEWKVTITSVRQGYESIENRHDYRTGLGITYRCRGASIDIGKPKNNYNKDEKPRCFNCNVYGHIAKDC